MKIIAILLILSFFLAFIILANFLLRPFFFTPKLSLKETVDYLGRKKYAFVEKRSLTKEQKKYNPFKSERDFFNKIYFATSYYIVIVFDLNSQIYKMLWLQLKMPLSLFGKRQIDCIEEKNNEINFKLQKKYSDINIQINNFCPACGNVVQDYDKKCTYCGLFLDAK